MKDKDKDKPRVMYAHTNGQPQNASNYAALANLPPNQMNAPGPQVPLHVPQNQPMVPNGRGIFLYNAWFWSW